MRGVRSFSKAAWQLVQDMRRAVVLAGGDVVAKDHLVLPKLLESFVTRAQQLSQHDVEAKVSVFYWLSKCAQSSEGPEPLALEELFLKFTEEVKKEMGSCSDSQLLKVLRSLITSRNRNKIQKALESDAQVLMDQFATELLLSYMQRLKSRHRHLGTNELSAFISSYAHLWQPEFQELFLSLVPELCGRVKRAKREKLAEWLIMTQALPFILESYAKVRCADEQLFETSLGWLEAILSELTYDTIAIAAHATAIAGLQRPSLWLAIHAQLESSRHLWSLRAMGRICSAFRRFTWEEEGPLHDVFKLVSMEMLSRAEHLSFHEVTELLLGLASSRKQSLPRWKEVEDCCKAAMPRILDSAPPIYLCHMFYAYTALDLAEGATRPEAVQVSSTLAPVLNVCLAPELEIMGQALLALSVRASPERLSSLGFRVHLQVAQREAVRKAQLLGPQRAARLACVLTAAAQGWPRLQRSWFLSEMMAFTGRQEDRYGQWLQAALEGQMEPWPSEIAWYFNRMPSQVPLVDVYGSPERLSGLDYESEM